MSSWLKFTFSGAVLIAASLSATAFAAGPAGPQTVSYSSGASAPNALLSGKSSLSQRADSETYVLSAPPRESAQAGAEIYQPIALYLSAVTGKKIVYRQPADWIAYQAETRRGEYDLVFDDPHFNAWRVANQQHNLLTKIGGDQRFVVVVKNNANLPELKKLIGRRICALSPPSLGTLTVLNEFDNPARQPVIVNSEGWNHIYQGMQTGQCAAAILPVGNLAQLDPHSAATRVLFKTRPFPQQGLSASQRVSLEDQAKISRALIAPEAASATAKLRAAYALSGNFLPVVKDEYAGIASILKDTWGYQ